MYYALSRRATRLVQVTDGLLTIEIGNFFSLPSYQTHLYIVPLYRYNEAQYYQITSCQMFDPHLPSAFSGPSLTLT